MLQNEKWAEVISVWIAGRKVCDPLLDCLTSLFYRMSKAGQVQPLCLLMVRETSTSNRLWLFLLHMVNSGIHMQNSVFIENFLCSKFLRHSFVLGRFLSKAVLQICFSTAHSQLLSADTPLLTPLVIFLHYSDISWYFKYFLCSGFFFYSVVFLSIFLISGNQHYYFIYNCCSFMCCERWLLS